MTRRRQPDGHHGLLPFGHQHARDPAARCAGEGALPAESLEPEGGGIGTQRAEEGHERAARARSRAARKARDIVKAELPEVLITGCRDTQTSADAFINGRYNGALTFALVEAMRKSQGRLTYRQLHDRAAAVLKTRKFEQVPQLEGRTDTVRSRRCSRAV